MLACDFGLGMLVHWLLFSGVSYCDDREHIFIFVHDTKKERTTRHLAI
jgi:hypothetical protein